jgi:hypothetical protein
MISTFDEKINHLFWRNGMGILASQADERVKNVRIDEDMLSVDLIDGRTISVPLLWYPKLFHATKEQLSDLEVVGGGYGFIGLN